MHFHYCVQEVIKAEWGRQMDNREKTVLMLTKMDTRKILINKNQIQTVEASPDTVIILSGGRKLLVKETIEEIYNMLQNG